MAGKPHRVKMRSFFVVVGVLFVLGFLVKSGELYGHLCIHGQCVGAVNSGLHIGDVNQFTSQGTQPSTTG